MNMNLCSKKGVYIRGFGCTSNNMEVIMRLVDKVVNRYSKGRIAVAFVAVAISMVQLVSGIVYAMSKQVSIVDSLGRKTTIETYLNNAADVLAQVGIKLNEGDEVTPALDETLKDGDIITISRAKKITLVDGVNSFEKLTGKKTVGEVYEQFAGDTTKGTVLNHNLDDEVYEGMVIEIAYLSEEVVSVETEVAFSSVKKATSAIPVGTTTVKQEGQNGLTNDKYKIYYENGKEVARELVERTVVKSPVNEIVEYGVRTSQGSLAYHSGGSVVSRSGGTFRYKKYIDCTATAYDLSYESCGKSPGDKGYGITASGMKAAYGVIAVDTRVIPLGTKLYIEAADGSWVYGNAVAGDTGGAIRGNRIDLFFNTRQECLNFGKRTARVYILE